MEYPIQEGGCWRLTYSNENGQTLFSLAIAFKTEANARLKEKLRTFCLTGISSKKVEVK